MSGAAARDERAVASQRGAPGVTGRATRSFSGSGGGPAHSPFLAAPPGGAILSGTRSLRRSDSDSGLQFAWGRRERSTKDWPRVAGHVNVDIFPENPRSER